MAGNIATGSIVRFGMFHVDLRSGELFKGAVRIKIEGKPFQILDALLAHPGEPVGKEELRLRRWHDVVVDFESSIKVAVSKLRQALGDSGDNPQFVETIPRCGYRFIGVVQHNTPGPMLTRRSERIRVAIAPFSDLG